MNPFQITKIRNFSIIAHINHGKSTLSDFLIKNYGNLNKYNIENQILDSMEIERERGITIKAQSVTLYYQSLNYTKYQLNFIDTPGHVDFSYEVSRALSACEGVILLIDATKGIEAQTLAHYSLAKEMNLTIIFAVNKIDLPNSNVLQIIHDIQNVFKIDMTNVVCCSAKTGEGISCLLEKLIYNIPPPKGNPNISLQALIIDSWFDNYLGIVLLICVKNGKLQKNNKIKVISANKIYQIDNLGIFTPKRISCNILYCGQIGWLTCSIKDIHGAPVGDTLTDAYSLHVTALPGFKKINPLVYSSFFVTNVQNNMTFRNALDRLSLNDSSLFYEPEYSKSFGYGFRCGFLGLLHMEIIKERLEREYQLNLIVTTPTVTYEILTINKKIIYIDNPSKLPSINHIVEFREPIAECHIISPILYLNNIIKLCIKKRGIQTEVIDHGSHIKLICHIPMSEIITNFFNQLKSISHGYASLDYKFKHFQRANMVKIDILINKKLIDALSFIVHKDHALYYSNIVIKKLHQLIPRQQFNIIIQAAIGKHIMAHAIVAQLKKNVIAKCYGGDISRKKKLIQKQIQGKKRMKKIGNIILPQEIFFTIMNLDGND